jgi:hypothetical protein
MHTVHCGRGPLVELAGDVFHGDVLLAGEVAAVGHGVGHNLTEHAVAAFLNQLVAEAEQVINIDEPEALEVEGEILIQLRPEAVGLDSELLFFFRRRCVCCS